MWLDDLAFVLSGDGVASSGTNLFISSKAAVPVLASGAATLHLISTGGSPAVNTQNQVIRPAYLQPSAQFTARADDFDVALAMASSAYFSVYKIRNKFINSGWYQFIRPMQEPFDGGVDDRGQCLVQFNVHASMNER